MARNEFSHTSMGNIIEVENPVNPGLPGNRNDTILREAFRASPIYVPAANADTKDRFKNLVLEGVLAGEGPKGSGFVFSTYNRDFVGDSLRNPADSSKDIARLTIGSYGIGVSSPQD